MKGLKYLGALFVKKGILILGLGGLLVTYQNCSPVEFAAMSSKLQKGQDGDNQYQECKPGQTDDCVLVRRRCDGHVHGESWFRGNGQSESSPRKCDAGGETSDQYHQEEEVACDDGMIRPTGRTRRGGAISRGRCPRTPENCGEHRHGEKWWSNADETKEVPRKCEETGVIVKDQYAYERQYECRDGEIEDTGEISLGKRVVRGECPGEQNCGDHTEGSIWYSSGDPIRRMRNCPLGGQVEDLFEGLIEMTCKNHQQAPTGRVQVGKQIREGACGGVGTCGTHNNGDSWTDPVDGEITEPRTCPNGLETNARYKKNQQRKCQDGKTVDLGAPTKGDLISTGQCPLAGCGKFSHGDLWFLDNGKERSTDKFCQFGPTNPPPKIYYEILDETKCDDGKSSPTGNTKVGKKKREEGTCHACTPGAKDSCPIPNGRGEKVCRPDGSAWGQCTLTGCDPKFRRVGDRCEAMICDPGVSRPCNTSDQTGIWSETCNSEGSAWGTCTFQNCRPNFVRVNGSCLPRICEPGTKIRNGCTQPAGGISEKTCNDTGTDYGSCQVRCDHGVAPQGGQCPAYSWQPTDNWSTCSADCGGQQAREYVCISSFGGRVDDSRCTSATKPDSKRPCNLKTGPWTDPNDQETTDTGRRVCPDGAVGFIEELIKKRPQYHCENFVKKTTFITRIVGETNRCSDVTQWRCSHDSLDTFAATMRFNWMKACENSIPAIHEFFEKIGGADHLTHFMDDTRSSNYGQPRSRPLYVTFGTDGGVPWYPPQYNGEYSPDCSAPSQLKILGVCTSSCYTPEQKLAFLINGDPAQVPIIEARQRNLSEVMTVADTSHRDSIELKGSPVTRYITELVDTHHKVRVFELASGGTLSVTPGHPVMDTDGYMREAIDMKVGQRLVRADGKSDEIVRITEVDHFGKVYNIVPAGTSLLGQVVVAQGYLNGSAFYQNEGARFMNQQILRKTLTTPAPGQP